MDEITEYERDKALYDRLHVNTVLYYKLQEKHNKFEHVGWPTNA